MTDAEEALARLRIYLANRIAAALAAARTSPEDSPSWMWGHITSEELMGVIDVIDGKHEAGSP